MIVVLGAFGRTGSVVVAQLRAAARTAERGVIRVVTRDPSRMDAATGHRAGVEVAVVRRFDPEELGRVTRGARALYAILPDDLAAVRFRAERRAMIESMASAIVRENVPRVVLLSSRAAALGEDGHNGLGADLAYFERLALETNAAVTVLRASYFQDNVAALLPIAAEEGVYPDYLPQGSPPLVTIAAADVGAFAARALLEPPRKNREIVDLVGPRYTPSEIAGALERAVGRRVSVMPVPVVSQREQLQRRMSPEAAQAMVETLQCLGSDRPPAEGDGATGDRVEHGALQLDQVLREALDRAASTRTGQPTGAAK